MGSVNELRSWIWAFLTVALLFSIACSSTDNQREAAPSATSTSSSVHVISPSDCPELTCQGPLELGTFRSTILDPTIEFEVTTLGWTWDYSAGGFRLLADTSHEDLYTSDGIYFLRDPAIASQDCEEAKEPGVGRSVGELVSWLEAAPGLAISEPTPVTIGGLDGMQLDLKLDPQWSRPCFWSNELPTVPLVFRGSAIGGYTWAILPDTSMRWYLLESDDGVIIVDIEDGPGGASRQELLKTGTEIVDSLAFS